MIDYWVQGYSLAKYKQKPTAVPAKKDDDAIYEWMAGFEVGSQDVCQHYRIDEYYNEMMNLFANTKKALNHLKFKQVIGDEFE